jgi:hypothetical protein
MSVVLVQERLQVWQEACMNAEIAGCSAICVRNKNVPDLQQITKNR